MGLKGLEAYSVPDAEEEKPGKKAASKRRERPAVKRPEKKAAAPKEKEAETKAIYIPVTVTEHREIKTQATAEGKSIKEYARKKLGLDA